MGVSFILTVHITLLGIISVGCRRSFLPFNNMTPQITKDEKMIKCGILHLLAGWWWTSCGWLIITIIIFSHYSTWHYPKSSQWMLRQSIVKAYTVHCFWISKHTGPPNKDTPSLLNCCRLVVDIVKYLLFLNCPRPHLFLTRSSFSHCTGRWRESA